MRSDLRKLEDAAGVCGSYRADSLRGAVGASESNPDRGIGGGYDAAVRRPILRKLH